jgi:hypothetical protein
LFGTESAGKSRTLGREIAYTLDVKETIASETLRKREGMCTNKANLQVVLFLFSRYQHRAA